MNVPMELRFTIQISLQQLSVPAASILASVFNHHSFHLTHHIFPSLTFTIIIIGPAVDQFRSHYSQKSLLWSSLVLSIFRYVAFHYAQKPVTRLSVYTSLPTACVIPILSKPAVISRCLSSLRILLNLYIVTTIHWTVRGLNPRRGKIFHSRPSRCISGLSVGQGGRKVMMKIRPF